MVTAPYTVHYDAWTPTQGGMKAPRHTLLYQSLLNSQSRHQISSMQVNRCFLVLCHVCDIVLIPSPLHNKDCLFQEVLKSVGDLHAIHLAAVHTQIVVIIIPWHLYCNFCMSFQD